MEASSRADAVVCDYNYVFSPILDSFRARLGRPLKDFILVVDEAHNLPDRIRSHLCRDLSPRGLLRASREAQEIDSRTARQLLGVARSMERFLLSLRGERTARTEELIEVVEGGLHGSRRQVLTYEDLSESVAQVAEEALRRGRATSLQELADFLRRWVGQDEGLLRLAVPGAEGKFALRLLDPSVLSQPTFDSIHAAILMSGTLHPPEMFADELGISPSRRLLRAYRSPFPAENRLLLAHPRVTTQYAKRTAEMFRTIASEIEAIAAVVPGNVAAFFPSYELLGEALRRLQRTSLAKRLLVERADWDKAHRDGTLRALRLARANGGALLLGVQGGSLSEGVDYEDNLLQAVVVVGLPISPPNVFVESLKDYYDRRFGRSRGYDYAYVFPAVNKVLQAAGRPIRSERDRAAIVLLESRLLSPRYGHYLPPSFAPRRCESLSREVTRFLAPRSPP